MIEKDFTMVNVAEFTTTVELKQKASFTRMKILNVAAKNKAGHIASAFSIVELLIVLYHRILNTDPKNPDEIDRDRFILSKGHGCLALYTVLAGKNFFTEDVLDTFCQPESILGGHPEMQKVPGIEASTGSLGHGLSIAIGISLAAKYDHKKFRTFCLLGDGECNEGSIWEAVMSAAHYKLDNLVAIIDNNKFQSSGPTERVLSLGSLAKKWQAFGWKIREIDGHDIEQIMHTLQDVPFKKNCPSVVIAHTVKGKGVSFIENNNIWHTKLPDAEELKGAYAELQQSWSNRKIER